MNYFEHHIGDYDEATSHLSACEDGIYHRLIRKYYAKEKPLPADVRKVQRLARCRDDAERQAVIDVLDEFFELREDGYHQKTCDEKLAEYKLGEPERVIKKANESNRTTRHRLERSRLFQVIVAAGQHAKWNAPIDELRTLVASIEAQESASATAGDREQSRAATESVMSPATAPVTLVTATNPQTPTSNTEEISNPSGSRAPDQDLAGTPAKGRVPVCPYEQIVEAYHANLPSLPKVLMRDGPTWTGRQKAMKTFWEWVLSSHKSDGTRRAETAAEAIEWVTAYFVRASDNDFVMGRERPGQGHENWRADLDYLLSPKGQKQVIEKTRVAA